MASIIKNQIIKHLSSFARNLKPEQISVEVLRGKGQLRDLELNEEILAERLELPPWLKIVRAHCSSVSVKIPWTHLKSAPVELFVEELRITIRLVASSVANSRKPELNAGKPYDLAERVIEGISLHVQSIEIFFETDSQSKISFGGSIMLSQFILESRKPTWQEEHGQKININMTRMHDKTIRQVLFFKHISWRVLKIEASSNVKGNDCYGGNGPPQQRSSLNSPLRFLTENGRCRITIKKSSLDCSLIAGRIELFLEEIHWLAYMAHLRSAIDFYKHILDLANSTSKDLPPSMAKQRHQQPFPKEKLSTPTKTSASAFGPLDIVQSSHHLRISRIDLHLCDDSSTDDLPPDWNIESGAMQAIVQKLNIDFYPQNQVFEQNGDFSLRRSWLRYSAPNPFTDLAKLQLDQHLRVISCQMEPNMLDRFVRIWPQLCSRNVVIRIENLIIQAISERSTKKDEMKCLFSMNRRAKEKLPNSISFFHLETASYCFPATNAFPVPPNSVHLMLAPFELIPDPKSMRWLVYAFENILNSLEAPQICNSPTFQTENPKPEIRIELLMPKAVLMSNDLPTSPFADPGTPSPNSPSSTDYRLPKRFLVQASTIFLSNFTLLNDPYMPIPLMCRQRMSNSQMEFIKWAEQNCPKSTLLKHLTRRNSQSANMESLLERDQASNEWFLCIPSLWANSDFGADTWELPFLTDLSLSGFVAIEEKKGTIILVEPRTDIGLALDHFQFIQLNKLMDGVNALMDQINSDRQFFRKTLDNLQEDLPLTICFQCEKTHIRLILPTGPTPSPYDTLPWANRNNNNDGSPTNTSFSYSDLPQDEAVNPGLTPLNLSSRKKTFVDSAKGSSSALADSFTPPTAEPITPNATVETVGGLAVQGGLKTVNSLTEMSNVSLTGKLPVEVQVSRKQVLGPANLPDFASATPSDLESNIDDTMSLTSVSTEQIGFDGSLVNLEDDIFGGSAVDDAVEAEEALEESGQNDIRVLKQKIRFLGREINVFDVLLEDLNLHAKAVGGRTTAFGFATNIHIGERLRANCSKIYEEKGSTFDVPVPFGELEMKREPAVEESQQHEKGRNPMEEAKVKMELRSAMRQSVIKLDIGELDISLNDEVVSQLAPFIQTPTEDANPPALELNLQKCRIEIKDPKKRFPFRIKLGGLSIHDGPESQKQSE